MIKSIEKIKQHNRKYILDFMLNCTIEEKLDTHYITIKILSKHDIKIYKANGAELSRADMILNSMWNKLILDWNYLKLSNNQWFEKYAGYSIKLFYFPCKIPILTEYDDFTRYVIDTITYLDEPVSNVQNVIAELRLPSVYKIDFKHYLRKIPQDQIKEVFNTITDESDFNEIFKQLIDPSNKLFAVNEPESYIFKWNTNLYKTDNPNDADRKITAEKTSYEFLLCNFLKYINSTNYQEKISTNYVKTVSNLFNDYIVNYEKQTNYVQNNIEAESLEPPYLGTKFDISYDYIPDLLTSQLCQESTLYKNIYKVLLANLSRGKDIKHCIFMNRKQVDDWNNLVKYIKLSA